MYFIDEDNWKNLSRILFPVIMLMAFAYSLVVVLQPVQEPVPDEDWMAAEAAIAADNRKGDLLIVHPAWEDGALRYFKDNYIILGPPNKTSYKTYPKIWVILSHGSGLPGYLDQTHTPTYFDLEVGALRILKYVKAGDDGVTFSFYHHYMDAEVEIQRGKEKRPCNVLKHSRWTCPIKDWNVFGPRTITVDGQSEHCLWMHPIKDWTTRATYRGVLLSMQLAGKYALKDSAAKFFRGTPVIFSVFFNRRKLGTYTTDNTIGWKPFSIDTSDLNGEVGDIIFEVESERDKLRHFGFRARISKKPIYGNEKPAKKK